MRAQIFFEHYIYCESWACKAWISWTNRQHDRDASQVAKGPGKIYWGHGAGAKGHGANTFFYRFKTLGGYFFFAVSGHGADTFFPPPWNQKEAIYRKNAVAAIFFTEVAYNHWNAVAPIEVYRRKKSETARSYYSEYYESLYFLTTVPMKTIWFTAI